MYDLYRVGKVAEASRLQGTLAIAEVGFGDGGINGTKWVVGELLGYPQGSRHCRRPYPKFVDVGRRDWIVEQVRHLEVDEARLKKLSG